MFFESYIKSLVESASKQDLPGVLYNMSLVQFYDYMTRHVKYKAQVYESVDRDPAEILKNGGDCGEKTKICMLYFKAHKISFELVFLKVAENKFHIFPRVNLNGQFIDFDTAYNYLKIGNRFMLDEVYRKKIA